MSNLSDVKRKPITVELRGREYELMYSLEAFAQMEEEYGSVDAAMTTLQEGKIKDIKFFIHAALLHMDNPPTQIDVAKMIDFRELNVVMAKIMEALNTDAPQSPDQNPNK